MGNLDVRNDEIHNVLKMYIAKFVGSPVGPSVCIRHGFLIFVRAWLSPLKRSFASADDVRRRRHVAANDRVWTHSHGLVEVLVPHVRAAEATRATMFCLVKVEVANGVRVVAKVWTKRLKIQSTKKSSFHIIYAPHSNLQRFQEKMYLGFVKIRAFQTGRVQELAEDHNLV